MRRKPSASHWLKNESLLTYRPISLVFFTGAQVVKRVIQKLPHPENRTFIGSGKVEEIRLYLENHTEVNLVIFDDDLSGKQTNTLEEILKVKIIDRSAMILDIFAERAKTAQAKTQVELAQLQYLLPRLRGLWTHLERQRGGIGMRGPGEKEIETDKRIVEEKITLLKKDLHTIDRQNATQRKQRGTQIRVARPQLGETRHPLRHHVRALKDVRVRHEIARRHTPPAPLERAPDARRAGEGIVRAPGR